MNAARVSTVALVGLFVSQPVPAQSADRPSLHRRIPHPAVADPNEDAADATFGWSMVMGDVNGGTSADELVITSFFLDVDPFGPGTIADVGAAYPFYTRALIPHPHPKPDAQNPELKLHLGRLYPAIGDVHEEVSGERLVFLGAIGADVDYGGGNVVTDGGTVEVFDLNLPAASDPNVLSLAAPTASSEQAPTGPGYPAGLRSFGHGIATGDIDGDGHDELVVGAHDSDVGQGRVYVFFSHGGFLNNPYRFWVGLRSPAGQSESFGASVLVADLNGDGLGELVVGATERYLQPAPPTTRPGRVYVFDAQTVLGLAQYLSLIHI